MLRHINAFGCTKGTCMRPMSTSEALDFLGESSRTGKLAWVAADGRPHVAPIWFIVEDGELLFATGTRSGKGHWP